MRLRAGDVVEGYEVVSRLSAGGMATLYLARRTGPGGFSRPVALKVVHEHLAHEESFRSMFLDEARLLSLLRHPNIVHVEALGETPDGGYYLAMEYIHGATLDALARHLQARGERFPQRIAVRVACEVAEALHAAHQARSPDGRLLEVIHRDVSPHNVLLSTTGHVKVIDFGIARALGRAQRTTETGLLKGKLRYMAPEQALGERVDHRVDQYAVGVMLWESLSGRQLFDADDEFRLYRMVCEASIPPLEEAVPRSLAAVVMRALARDPALRWPDCRALAQALLDALPDARAVDAAHLARWMEPMPVGVPSAEPPLDGELASTGGREAPLADRTISEAKLESNTRFAARVLHPRSKWPWLVGAAVLGVGGAGALAFRGTSTAPSATATTRTTAALDAGVDAPHDAGPAVEAQVSTADLPVGRVEPDAGPSRTPPPPRRTPRRAPEGGVLPITDLPI